MKLPKNFGGQGLGNMMRQAQEAMSKAQNLEAELGQERFTVDKGQVQAVFTGLGMLESLKIDPAVVDPEDVEALEDLLVSAVRDGLERANELRTARMQQILPPNLGI